MSRQRIFFHHNCRLAILARLRILNVWDLSITYRGLEGVCFLEQRIDLLSTSEEMLHILMHKALQLVNIAL